jgi:hypothetical protein
MKNLATLVVAILLVFSGNLHAQTVTSQGNWSGSGCDFSYDGSSLGFTTLTATYEEGNYTVTLGATSNMESAPPFGADRIEVIINGVSQGVLLGNILVAVDYPFTVPSGETWTITVTARNNEPLNEVHTVALCEAPLVVSYGPFTAQAVGSGAAFLQWSTLTEKNNAYFGIEISQNGVDYREVGVVAAVGNSNTETWYSYRVEGLAPGVYHLRLRDVDTGGNTSYSEVRVVIVGGGETLKVTPNPTSGFVQVSGLAGAETLMVIDQSGQKIISVAVLDSNLDLQLPGAGGTYFLITNTGKYARVIKK